MRDNTTVGVVIPALDEQDAIRNVLADIPRWVDAIVVADNDSSDRTADVAREMGATVVHEPEKGYGAACLAGLDALAPVDIVVFLDGDYSDHPEEMASLVDPIIAGTAAFVVGSRVLGAAEAGALSPQQRLGNGLACWLMRRIWGAHYTDLGPFRAIRRTVLDSLAMSDRNYGWTVEMQIKAARSGVAFIEVPVSYRARIGVSKVSGTVKGTVLAGTKILRVIARHALRPARAGKPRGGIEQV